jgi:hypothetical protein
MHLRDRNPNDRLFHGALGEIFAASGAGILEVFEKKMFMGIEI